MSRLHGKRTCTTSERTYYSALGESDSACFWQEPSRCHAGKRSLYLDLLPARMTMSRQTRRCRGHKEINRTNLSEEDIKAMLETPIVKDQLELLRFRKNHPAFVAGATVTVEETADSILKIRWEKDGSTASLTADLENCTYTIDKA